MSPLALLLHAWRLRRIRLAMRTLNRRMAAYETVYGTSDPMAVSTDFRTANGQAESPS